jgi:hypothetical protein
MANSGGGIVVIRPNDKGQHSGKPVNAVLDLDPATITDEFVKYTDENFDGVNIQRTTRVAGRLPSLR